MASIIPLKDSTGAQFYPQTHEKAVIDSNGVNLQTKLQNISAPSYVVAWDGDSTPVVANIPAGVTFTYGGNTYTGTLAASSSTLNKTYLVGDNNGNFDEYVTQVNGSTYSWQYLGNTEIDLSDYATKDELSQLDQEINGYIWTEGKYLKSSGAEDTDAAWGITDYIPYTQGNDVTWKWGNAEAVAGGRTINFYKADKTYISNGYWSANGTTGQKSITAAGIAADAPAAAYIRASFKLNEGASVVIGTRTAWEQNDGLVKDVQKNAEDIEELNAPILKEISPAITSSKILNQDGTLSSTSAAWGVSDLVPVKAGEKYTIKATQYPDSPYVGVQVLDAGENVATNYIVGVNLVNDQDKIIEIQANGFLRIGVRISAGYSHSIKLNIPVRDVLELSGAREISKNVCFVGHSIWWYDSRELAAGFLGGVTAVGYQSWLRRLFTFKSDSGTSLCVNGGSLGATSATDENSIMYLSSNWPAVSDAIWTLDTITNDFKRDIPIGTLSDYENNTGILTYYGALRAFKDKVAALSGEGAVVICSNALHRNNDGYTSTSENGNGDTLADFELALCNVAAMNGWHFVDQFRFSSVQDENLQATTIDGLHLNNYGYSLAVKPWIEEFNLILLNP